MPFVPKFASEVPPVRASFGIGALAEKAPAKINLTLRVLGRRVDGYHEIESLVAFASLADVLSFTPARTLQLAVRGPTAELAGPIEDNLVLKAAQALDSLPWLKDFYLAGGTALALYYGHRLSVDERPVRTAIGQEIMFAAA